MLDSSGRKPEKRYPKFEPLAETLERVIENIKSRTGKPDYETGLAVLDQGIFGLHKSQMTIVAARPGIGKKPGHVLSVEFPTMLEKRGRRLRMS